MLLQYYPVNFKIPHTSTCIIKAPKELNDGDTVTVTSPLFSSIDFTSNQFNLSSGLDLPLRRPLDSAPEVYICDEYELNGYPDVQATLVCDDNDVFNMYVKIEM